MPQPARKSASTRRSRSPKVRDSVSSTTPKGTQRERLIDAIIELAAQYGYQNVSIAQISARAGVSSATFYEQFKDKEDCLLAAYRAARARVFRTLAPVPDSDGWSATARMMLAELFVGLQGDPDAGRVLFVESLAGGPRMRAERERVLETFEGRVQAFLDTAAQTGDTLDIPVAALEGARRNIVSRELRTHGEDRLDGMIPEMLVWMESYAVTPAGSRWSTGPRALLPAPAQPPADPTPAGRGERPARLPRGRHGLPPSVVTRSQRTRIVFGTAEVMRSKGYANATVADIVAAAGISRDVFYEHFADKQNAFLEAQQFATQYIFDSCSEVFFSVQDWPERVWRALGTLLELIASNPALAHLRVVECYAAGPAATRSTEELLRAATVFLEEGYSYGPEGRRLSRLCSHAITGSVFEVIYRLVASGRASELPLHLPQLSYIALAPFIGRDEAISHVERFSAQQPTPATPA
jgi:AcrR family transcriptional regulator